MLNDERNDGLPLDFGNPFEIFEMFFERLPMGVAILDREFRIQRYNPTWADFSSRYAPPEGLPLTPGVNYFKHIPGSEAVVRPMYERVLNGETVRQNGVRLDAGDIITYWDVVLIPLKVGDEIIGIFSLSNDVTEQNMLQQQLEERVNQRTQELEQRHAIAESLRDIIGMINSKMPLEELLNQAVNLASKHLGAAGCILHRFDLENEVIIHQASYGMEGIFEKGSTRSFEKLKPSGADGYLQATLNHQPTFGNYPPKPERIDLLRNDPSIPENVKERRIALRERFAGSFSVPLFFQDQVYGGMAFYYTEPQAFSEEQIQLGMVFAEQVAIALQNASLFEKAAEAAILSERNRLARDLHDAVTQTLFSASMIADVLPKIWDRNPDEGYRRLEELRQLTRGALSEMRTLLVELRPAALEDTDLSDLIRHQVNAFIARTRLDVVFEKSSGGKLPPRSKRCFTAFSRRLISTLRIISASIIRVGGFAGSFRLII